MLSKRDYVWGSFLTVVIEYSPFKIRLDGCLSDGRPCLELDNSANSATLWGSSTHAAKSFTDATSHQRTSHSCHRRMSQQQGRRPHTRGHLPGTCASQSKHSLFLSQLGFLCWKFLDIDHFFFVTFTVFADFNQSKYTKNYFYSRYETCMTLLFLFDVVFHLNLILSSL